MKGFNRHHLALLPILSILSLSPYMLESQSHQGRSLASVKEEVKGHPRYESLVAKIKPESLMKDVNISFDKFKLKRDELKAMLVKEKEEFKKDQSNKEVVSAQRKKLESLVIDVLLVETSLNQLQEKNTLEASDKEESAKMIAESKDIVEGLLSDLEANEILVAGALEPKKEDKPIIVEGPKKEAPKKEICEADEKNKILTSQVEELMKQNQQILQSMLNVTQMMVSMYQQQQQQYFQNGPGWNTSPYQYHQPQTAGNWVYYPNGFQPGQTNIFNAPQMLQNPRQEQGFYPDQMHQQMPMSQVPSNWSMQPDPRFQVQGPLPGGFIPGNFGFNVSNSVPTISQR
jgi:hypothetical protein